MAKATMQSIRLAQPANSSLAEPALLVVGADNDQPRPRLVALVCSRLFREGLQRLLAGPGMVISAGYQTVAEAVEAMAADQPADLVIVVACTEAAIEASLAHIGASRTRLPTTKWLLLTDCLSPERLREAVECGVQGVLQPDISGDVLRCSAELLLLGQTMLPPGLVDLFAPRPAAREATTQDGGDRPAVGVTGPPHQTATGAPIHLSERELQILQYLVKGFSNKQIARELAIADATVKVHVKGLLRKMRVTNRTQVAVLAMNYAAAPQPGATVVELPTDALRASVADAIRQQPAQAEPGAARRDPADIRPIAEQTFEQRSRLF
jgi:two-component system nitrate/nitrite response regulator NarL